MPTRASIHFSGRTMLTEVSILCLLLSGCGTKAAQPETQADEAATFATDYLVRITAAAQKETGLTSVPAVRRLMQDSISTTGWLQAIPGTEFSVRSPVTGHFSPESQSLSLSVGQGISEGQSLGNINVFFSPQEIAQLVFAKEEADILIEQSQVTLDIAEEQLRNLTEKKASQAVAGTRLQELRAMAERARAALKSGQEKLPFLPQEPYDGSMRVVPVSVAALRAGIVTDVHVVPEQFVVQGDPLYTVVNWRTLWLRVPLFERDFQRVISNDPGIVSIPGEVVPVSVKPIEVPQAMPSGSRSLSRYYSIDNATLALRPGQPLIISVPVSQSEESIVVPRSSLLWDGLGNTWVYVRMDAETFRRTRVETGSAPGEDVEICRGLEDGSEVVTLGAETLYGEEFKGQLQAGDDD